MQRLLQLSTWATAFVDRHEEAVASGSDAKQSQDVFDAVCQVSVALHVPLVTAHADRVGATRVCCTFCATAWTPWQTAAPRPWPSCARCRWTGAVHPGCFSRPS